jgi:hypothetical protein
MLIIEEISKQKNLQELEDKLAIAMRNLYIIVGEETKINDEINEELGLYFAELVGERKKNMFDNLILKKLCKRKIIDEKKILLKLVEIKLEEINIFKKNNNI